MIKVWLIHSTILVSGVQTVIQHFYRLYSIESYYDIMALFLCALVYPCGLSIL